MARLNFSWKPDLGASQTAKPNVHQTKFGDGYELRAKIGINSNPKTWKIKITRDGVTAQAILAFLDAREGLESFTWTDPMGVTTGIYVCREWSSVQANPGVYEITATFEQVFEV